MPSPAIYPLRIFQLGKETTAGTAVAATWQMVGEAVPTWEIDRYMADYPRGVRTPVTAGGVPLRQGSLMTQTSDGTFEELMAPNESGLATGTLSGIANAMGHTYTPILTGNPLITTLTGEWAVSDGSATAFPFPGATGYPHTAQIPYLFCLGYDFEWAFNTITKVTTRYRGRAATFGTTPTASLTPLTGRERISGSQVYVSFDTTYAAMGLTPITGVVRSGKYSVFTGIEDDYTTDGRANLDFTQLRWGMDVYATLQLVMEMDATSALEIKAWIAQNAGGSALPPNTAAGGAITAPRFMRVQCVSPNEVATRTVSDAVSTAASQTITSATAAFTQGDVGAPITLTKAGAAAGTLTANIVNVTNATTALISPVAVSSGTAETLVISNRRFVGFDNSFVYTKAPVFQQQGKAEIVTLDLKTEYDPTSAKSLVVRLVNKLATFT